MRLLLALLLLLAACAEGGAPVAENAPQRNAVGAQPGPLGPPQGRWREQLHYVAVRASNGSTRLIQMRLCRPEGSDSAPLVLINHGAPPDASARPGFVATRCESEAAQWFLRRGFAVAAPLRRGYGASGGSYVEGSGPCQNSDFLLSARISAADLAGALEHARAQPGIDPARPALVVGQSAGGWAALGLAAQSPPGVGAVISMAGGRGGWARGPNTNCRPDLLVAAAGTLGAATRLPSLWVYAENDSYFGPELSRAMAEAYRAGGGPVQYHLLPPWGRDGHGLFFGQTGSDLWGPIVEAFLKAQGLLP